MYRLIISLISLLLFSCSANYEIQVDASSSELPQPSKPETILSQYDCPNQYCDNFSLEITGKSYKKIQDDKLVIHKTLNNDQQVKLQKVIDNLNLKKLKTSIMPGGELCGIHITEAQSYRFQFQKGDFAQTLEIYGGCKDIPAEYQAMIDWFKRLTESNYALY